MADYESTLESVKKCFNGLALYAAQRAAAGADTSEIRTFALDMVSFWGLDDADDGDRYESEFDRTVSEAAESGKVPEIAERVKTDVTEGLRLYATELDCVGGQDEFYQKCEAFSDRIGAEWGVGDEKTLIKRLDECLLNRFKDLSRGEQMPDTGALHEFSRHIIMHEYLTGEHEFEPEEIRRLLRFRDPLEVAVECVGVENAIHDLNLAYCLDRSVPEANFPTLSGAPLSRNRELFGKKTPENRRTKGGAR